MAVQLSASVLLLLLLLFTEGLVGVPCPSDHAAPLLHLLSGTLLTSAPAEMQSRCRTPQHLRKHARWTMQHSRTLRCSAAVALGAVTVAMATAPTALAATLATRP
jgi:hypothetical protein